MKKYGLRPDEKATRETLEVKVVSNMGVRTPASVHRSKIRDLYMCLKTNSSSERGGGQIQVQPKS